MDALGFWNHHLSRPEQDFEVAEESPQSFLVFYLTILVGALFAIHVIAG